MFADPEDLVIGYLDAHLDVGVSSRLPADPLPEAVVRVMLTGSTRRSVTHRDAQVTVECWAYSSTAAMDLAGQVHDLLEQLDTPGGHVPQGPSGWLGGPYADDDPLTGTPRYVQTVIVRQRRLP